MSQHQPRQRTKRVPPGQVESFIEGPAIGATRPLQEDPLAAILRGIEGLTSAVTQITRDQQLQAQAIEALQAGQGAGRLNILGSHQVAAAPEVQAQALVNPPVSVNAKMQARAEAAETRKRLEGQPYVEVLIEDEHVMIYGGLKVAFAPKDEILNMPIELANAYQQWKRGQANIRQFNNRLKAAGGQEGMIRLQELDAYIGPDYQFGAG